MAVRRRSPPKDGGVNSVCNLAIVLASSACGEYGNRRPQSDPGRPMTLLRMEGKFMQMINELVARIR